MLEDIRNFLRLSDHLLSSGMPTAEQLAEVAEAGVEVVCTHPRRRTCLAGRSGRPGWLGSTHPNHLGFAIDLGVFRGASQAVKFSESGLQSANIAD